MDCNRCEKFKKEHPYNGERHEGTNFASLVLCAFADGSTVFREDNWNCFTMSVLRENAYKRKTRWGDNSLGFVVVGEDRATDTLPMGFVVMAWYKDRGRTGQAAFIDESFPARPLTRNEAEELSDILEKEALNQPK